MDEGKFLFGARQTGKSTLLKERFKGAIYYDLLNPSVRRAFKLNPNSLWDALQDKPSGTEVDAVIGDAKAFKEEHPDCRLILVSLDPITRKTGDTELIYVLDFLKMLWNGEIF